jgi:hypothetical protein
MVQLSKFRLVLGERALAKPRSLVAVGTAGSLGMLLQQLVPHLIQPVLSLLLDTIGFTAKSVAMTWLVAGFFLASCAYLGLSSAKYLPIFERNLLICWTAIVAPFFAGLIGFYLTPAEIPDATAHLRIEKIEVAPIENAAGRDLWVEWWFESDGVGPACKFFTRMTWVSTLAGGPAQSAETYGGENCFDRGVTVRPSMHVTESVDLKIPDRSVVFLLGCYEDKSGHAVEIRWFFSYEFGRLALALANQDEERLIKETVDLACPRR